MELETGHRPDHKTNILLWWLLGAGMTVMRNRNVSLCLVCLFCLLLFRTSWCVSVEIPEPQQGKRCICGTIVSITSGALRTFQTVELFIVTVMHIILTFSTKYQSKNSCIMSQSSQLNHKVKVCVITSNIIIQTLKFQIQLAYVENHSPCADYIILFCFAFMMKIFN